MCSDGSAWFLSSDCLVLLSSQQCYGYDTTDLLWWAGQDGSRQPSPRAGSFEGTRASDLWPRAVAQRATAR